jgi:hypothetical protein
MQGWRSPGCLGANTVYGSAQSLRAGLESRKQAYALVVACKEYVDMQGTCRRVDQVARGLVREDWQELSAGTGSKGPRLFAWARIELAVPETSGWQRWLLVRRGLDEEAKPAEMAYVLVFAPDFHLFGGDGEGFRRALDSRAVF